MSGRTSSNYIIKPGGKLQGHLRIPGDKSISHRALMLAAIAEGQTRITGFLTGEDTLATLAAFQAMGVKVDCQPGDTIIVDGVGMHGLCAPAKPLDLGNSGTSVRLLAGLLAGQSFDSVLTGDASLQRRPMRRITEPLQMMQADVTCSDEGTLPLHIHGGRSLHGIDYELPVPSAQLKSCLLLAALYAHGKTCVHEPVVTRDHTERLLQVFGYPSESKDKSYTVYGGSILKATTINIPGDISSAAFFLVGACVAEGSSIVLENVGNNPTRNAVIPILQAMGADISVLNERTVSGEMVADIEVRSSTLHGIDIPVDQVAVAIDEFPAILIAAATADGKTTLTGAAELRVKESDRITAMAEGLQAIGIETETFADGMTVQGGQIRGGTINSYGDHRIAMAFAMAGLVATNAINILDCANVDTSFPGFVNLGRRAGLNIKEDKHYK